MLRRSAVVQRTPNPKINSSPILQGTEITELKYQENFKLWLVQSYTNEFGFVKSIFPLAFNTWTVNYWVDTFVAQKGATNNKGTVEASQSFTRSHAKPDVVLPPFANKTILIGD